MCTSELSRGSQKAYLGNLVHRVVQGGTATRASMGQPTVLLLQVLNSWQLLLRLAPGSLSIPDPSAHKLLYSVHLDLTSLQALPSVWQVLCIATPTTIQVVDKRRADAVVGFQMGRLVGRWR